MCRKWTKYCSHSKIKSVFLCFFMFFLYASWFWPFMSSIFQVYEHWNCQRTQEALLFSAEKAKSFHTFARWKQKVAGANYPGQIFLWIWLNHLRLWVLGQTKTKITVDLPFDKTKQIKNGHFHWKRQIFFIQDYFE